AKGWELDAQAGVGDSLTIQLQDPSGAAMANATADATGRIALYDLGLAPGTYRLDVAGGPDRPSPYLLRAVAAGPRPTADIEPNDDLAHASPLDPAKPAIKGRLARAGDVDVYRLTIDAALAAAQFDLKLIWRSKEDRELCLLDGAGQQLQCRTGAGGVALANLTLPPGDYGVAVSGDADPAAPYILRLERTSAPAADFETEPNDAVAAASTLAAGQTMRGRLTSTDTDYFRLHVTGAPQLWQARVDGAGVAELSLIDATGRSLASASAAYSGGRAQLADLFLTAGDHWLAVSGDGGDYTLRADPTGPPDPHGEREPNDTTTDAMPLLVGQQRTGRLVAADDVDFYRFSLAATDRVAIHITPPADGAVGFRLDWGSATIERQSAPAVGQEIVYDALLLPGDYDLMLTPGQPSEGKYTLSIERRDPLTLAADREPNDDFAHARPLSPTLSASGTVGAGSDDDWFLLATLAKATDVTIRWDGAVQVQLSDGTNDLPTTPNADNASLTANLPAATPVALRVSGDGP
ncbi:MAG TPA: hypothetical protein VFQ80_13225, partial [Thermomicrobiales bacterium]|nr:hypothetical protein [Thermomicrobiales bacterium]